MTPRLLVFCKAPVPGQVKTRLTSEFSNEQAAHIHEQLAFATLNQGLAVPDVTLELWCSPNTNHEFFEDFHEKGYALHEQQGRDLGERMANGFALSSAEAHGVLIGTDCPPIDAAYLTQALTALKTADVVIGPAEDGGYGLVALRGQQPELFSDITWSTDQVLKQTLQKAQALTLSVHLLPEIWDVDYPADVKRWRDQN